MGETEYLMRHWQLLTDAREALRTEPRVRIAILAGSTARGDDRPDSDVDLRHLRHEPLSLLQLLDEGRVLVDREGQWPELRAQRASIYKRAKRAYDRQQRQAATMLKGPPSDDSR